jgi:hypothetical protein
MAGMYFHSGHLLGIAREARDRAVAQVQANPDALPADTTVVIVLAAASTEAFINELAEMAAIERDNPLRQSNPIPAELRTFADALQEIEEARGSILLKYLMASRILSGSSFNKGINPFQDFAVLTMLRNDFMHLKPRDTFVEANDGALPKVKVPKYVEALQQRGLARTSDPEILMSWFNLLQTDKMATWACQTTHNIILAVLDLIPDNTDPSNQALSMFKGFL